MASIQVSTRRRIWRRRYDRPRFRPDSDDPTESGFDDLIEPVVDVFPAIASVSVSPGADAVAGIETNNLINPADITRQ